MSHDLINSGFELFGALAITLSIMQVLRDKSVAGISWLHIAFFFSWGVWNLFYYPSVGSMWSFYAGIAVAVTNFVYLCLLIYYTYKGKSVEETKEA